MDLWPILPYIALVFIFTGFLEIVRLACDEMQARRPARPLRSYAASWIGSAVALSMVIVANEAHLRGSIPLAAFVLAVILAGLAVLVVTGYARSVLRR